MFRNMRISLKLSLGFGLVLLVFVVAVAFSWIKISGVQEIYITIRSCKTMFIVSFILLDAIYKKV